MKYLSRPEEIVLLSVFKLKAEAYGVTIRNDVQEKTGIYWSIGSVYVPLERLEKKGYVQSYESEPMAERGGRRKRYFSVTDHGIEALEDIRQVHEAVWKDYPDPDPRPKTQ